MSEAVYTVDEVAALEHVDVETVRRWIRRGALTAYRAGGRSLRVRATELERFRCQGRVTVEQPVATRAARTSTSGQASGTSTSRPIGTRGRLEPIDPPERGTARRRGPCGTMVAMQHGPVRNLSDHTHGPELAAVASHSDQYYRALRSCPYCGAYVVYWGRGDGTDRHARHDPPLCDGWRNSPGH